MKRTDKKIRPDALLTSDWHLRHDTPICRTDEEFQRSQWTKVDFIKDLQSKYQCPVLHAGDLFNHWKPSPWLLSKTMQHLPEWFCTIFGNHDLPQHNIQEKDKCGIFALETARVLTLLPGIHWGYNGAQLRSFDSFNIKGRRILIWHVMTYQGKTPWPGCTDPKAGGILRKYPEYDLILTGHNHKAFTETHEGRLLVNPGSLTRQDADQIDFLPRIYLYYADTNTIRAVRLPIKKDAVSRAHIERSSERSERIDAFISKLSGEFQAGLNFEENLERFFQKNKVKKKEKEIIYKALES
ncbi:MAG: metallophosphoesterase family protein [Candidatus Peribacteraceae bacterium]|nr:metallophosphoesterase family protein [Candidatus Peribacteraceae bacterium]